jgi:hypothetical protein
MLVDGSIGAFNHQDGIAYLDAVHYPPRNADDDVAAAVAGRHGFRGHKLALYRFVGVRNPTA